MLLLSPPAASQLLRRRRRRSRGERGEQKPWVDSVKMMVLLMLAKPPTIGGAAAGAAAAAAAAGVPSALSLQSLRGTRLVQQSTTSKEDRKKLRKASKADTLIREVVLPHTEMSHSDKRIWVVTTASLPWMTGTSINPLLRAAYLTRGRVSGMVTLMLPFVDKEDQKKIYPEGVIFESEEEQDKAVRGWLKKAGYAEEAKKLKLVFYHGRFHKAYGSVFPMGDLVAKVPKEEANICILEEPEHLNWFRGPGPSWVGHFDHVVGVVHTNYLAYSSGFGPFGPVLTFLLKRMNVAICRAHTDKIIKLSSVIQHLAGEKEVVCNVHGVRRDFLQVGAEAAHSKGAYYVGKSLWAKGYDRLIDNMASIKKEGGKTCFPIDVYGSGPDKEAIMRRAKKRGLPCSFFPATDHAKLKDYKVFINPSVSEVLCTTIAEALAMGKWVVCSRHPSNEFFYEYPNCLTFSTKAEFAACVSYALRHEPSPLTDSLRRALTWDAATDRLFVASCVTVGSDQRRKRRLDGLFRVLHAAVGKGRGGDCFRALVGAGPAAGQVKYLRQARREARLLEEGGLGLAAAAAAAAAAAEGVGEGEGEGHTEEGEGGIEEVEEEEEEGGQKEEGAQSDDPVGRSYKKKNV